MSSERIMCVQLPSCVQGVNTKKNLYWARLNLANTVERMYLEAEDKKEKPSSFIRQNVSQKRV